MKHSLEKLQSKDQLYGLLESAKQSESDILESSDLKVIIDAVENAVEKATRSTKDFLLQRRFNLFYSYYPYFFQHIPNHLIVEVLAEQTDKFIDLELAEEFILSVSDKKFRFQAAIPFTFQPFQVSNCYLMDNKLSIEIDGIRPFSLQNRDRLLLSINPLALKNYQIYHMIRALKNNKSAKITLFSYQIEKPLEIDIKINFELDLTLNNTQEIILKSISQAVFSSFYIEFESIQEDILFHKMLVEIDILNLKNIPKVLPQNSFRTNLLPVFNLFDGHAMKIDYDYTKESFAIKHSESLKDYVPTKLYRIEYNKEQACHENLNFVSSKSYCLNFDSSGHMRISFLDPSVSDLSMSNEVTINAQWTQISSVDINKKSYTFLPLSRSIGNLNFKIINSYSFKRNQLLERAENILKVIKIINATRLSVELFKVLVSLITNDDDEVLRFMNESLVDVRSNNQVDYTIYIHSDLQFAEFSFYADLVQEFLRVHLSRFIGAQIDFNIQVV
ncbi:type VI secretion system baseplate subunit TssF/IglH [Francisella philomiragia]|uniref:type VI secretion system baseplate subunit TssF/IglH n=1 Tax=Francisella philomiragia TaxID=28110 RepID=UPI003517B237